VRQLIPCSVCRQRPEEKLSQVTWAWNPRPRERVAYRQRLCITCFCSSVLPLDKDVEPEGALTCPGCGIDTEHDMDPVYCTSFIPGTGKLQLSLPLCANCAIEVRNRAQMGAELLPEQEAGSRGQAPGTPPRPSVWEQLGIAPRE